MDKIKIHVLHCGQVKVDCTLPFRKKTRNPISYTGLFRSKKHQLLLPVSAYLIEHPKGLVLIDTGWHTDVRINQLRYLGPILYMINKAYLPAGEAIDEQLAQLGSKTSDIDYLVLSHLDCDHVSGLHLVKDAKKILVSRLDTEAAKADPIRYSHKMWKGVEMEHFEFTDSKYGPYKKSFDLFGDDSIVFVYVPGHSKGLAATLIQNNGKHVLLTSDCGYARKSWEKMILPGVIQNKKELTESLKWVKMMAADPACIETLANHDADVEPHIIEL